MTTLFGVLKTDTGLIFGRFEHWNDALSQTVGECGSSEFPNKLVTTLRCLFEFDLCMVFEYGQTREASALYHNVGANQAKLIIDDYLKGPYELDPYFSAAISDTEMKYAAMLDIAPDGFHRSEFYKYHYVNTGIADEMGVFFPVSEGRTGVLSITRQKPKDAFSNDEKRLFQATANIVGKLSSQHWTYPDSLQKLFDRFGDNVLTAREKEVVTLVLKGHSSLSISHVLNISAGTVKSHRKNAYEKLDVSSQAQLFSLFLQPFSA